MDLFGSQLRRRAAELELSNAEVARRLGVSQRRYAHYVTGTREPDLATLVRIAKVLETTPNWLLGYGNETDAAPSKKTMLKERLSAAANVMPIKMLEFFLVQAEAVASKK